MDNIQNLVSVEVLQSIYEDRKRYAKGDSFLCSRGRANQLGSSVKVLKDIHDPVMKDFIAPENTMIKETPIRKAEIEDIPVKPEYLCSVCGKKFSSKIGLAGHSRTHKKGK